MDSFKVIKPLLFSLEPELAHKLVISALKYGLVPSKPCFDSIKLKNNLLGIEFRSPIGLAAGFDKNAECINSLVKQNLSFIEVGTVTPLPQVGNSKPRIFRLEKEQAILNRLGFNNKGIDFFIKNIKKRDKSIVGANIGKNKDSENPMADYLFCMEKVYPYVDYITINISSPNTPGLRILQNKDMLDNLLLKLNQCKKDLLKEYNKNVPLLVKIAPDLSESEKQDIADNILKHSIDGLIISNTTINRENIDRKYLKEAGGISGRPLFYSSTELLRDMYKLCGKKVVIIGVGGIFTPLDAYKKILAGASLLQIYTSIIYKGFQVVNEINQGLVDLLKKDGFTNIKEAIGSARD